MISHEFKLIDKFWSKKVYQLFINFKTNHPLYKNLVLINSELLELCVYFFYVIRNFKTSNELFEVLNNVVVHLPLIKEIVSFLKSRIQSLCYYSNPLILNLIIFIYIYK